MSDLKPFEYQLEVILKDSKGVDLQVYFDSDRELSVEEVKNETMRQCGKTKEEIMKMKCVGHISPHLIGTWNVFSEL